MNSASFHIDPVYAILTITDSANTSGPVFQKRFTLHLLRAELLRNPEEPNGFAIVEQAFDEFLTLAEKHSAVITQITVAADLANAEMLTLLRLYLKKLDLPPITVREFAADFARMQQWVSNLPPEYLAVVAGEAKLRFIKVKQGQPEFILTLPCGIITLTHEFIRNDPPETAEIIALRDHLSAEFDRLQWQQLPERILTFSNAGLALTRLLGNDAPTGNPIITKPQLRDLLPELSHNYRNQTARHPGADPDFTDYFLTTALLYEHLLEHLGLEQVAVTKP
jgi:hypothetical protein